VGKSRARRETPKTLRYTVALTDSYSSVLKALKRKADNLPSGRRNLRKPDPALRLFDFGWTRTARARLGYFGGPLPCDFSKGEPLFAAIVYHDTDLVQIAYFPLGVGNE